MSNQTPGQYSEDLEGGQSAADILDRKAIQLWSMLENIYGAGFENFNGASDAVKSNYLWACADLAKQISILSGRVVNEPQTGGSR